MRKSLLIPLILLLAAGLGFLALRLSAASGAVPAETVTIQLTATPTRTSMPTATATPTATLEPTATATATPTPTPITLPVTNGTPIPDLPYEVITAENVHRLRQVARYGYPRLLDANPYRLTADGKTLVVGTTLGLEFYDAQTQEKTGGFEVEFLRSFDLTPDGQYLLTLAGETLTVWTKDGQKVREFDLQAGDAWQLNAAALSPDGALLAVQRKKTDWQEADKVDVYRVQDGSLVDTVRGNGALFSPNGQYLATVFDSSVRLYPAAELGQGWEKRLPKQTLPWCGDANERCGLAFSPDGTLAAVVRAARVDVYQVAERKLVRQVSGWTADEYSLPEAQFTPDGQRLLIVTVPLYDSQYNVKQPSRAILVDVASGEWLSKEDAPEGFVYTDGETIRAFRWQAEGEMPPYGTKWMHPNILVNTQGVVDLIVTDWWSLGWGKNAVTFRCRNEKCEKSEGDWKKVVFYDENLNQYEFFRNGTKGHVTYGTQQITVPASDWIFGYVIDSTHLLWSVSYSPAYGLTVLYDLKSGQSVLKTDYIHPIDFYKYDRYLFFTLLSDHKLRVFDLNENKLLGEEQIKQIENFDRFPEVQPFPVAFFDENKILRWKDPQTGGVCLWSGKECLQEIDSVFGQIFAMAFSPDERFLATNGEDGFIRVWAVVPEDAPVK